MSRRRRGRRGGAPPSSSLVLDGAEAAHHRGRGLERGAGQPRAGARGGGPPTGGPPTAIRPPPAAGSAAALVGIVAVCASPPARRCSARRCRRERPLELGHEHDGVAVRAEHQQGRALQRHRVVAGQVARGRARGDTTSAASPAFRGLGRQPRPAVRDGPVTASAGSVGGPSGTSPGWSRARAVRERPASGARTVDPEPDLRAQLLDVRVGHVVAVPVDRWAACVYASDCGPVNTSASSDAVTGERARGQPQPARGELRVADDHVPRPAFPVLRVVLDPRISDAVVFR